MARKLANDTKIGAATRSAAAVARCSRSRLLLIPVCHQNSNELKLTQRAQGQHIPVQNLCVLGVLCGYDNKSVSIGGQIFGDGA